MAGDPNFDNLGVNDPITGQPIYLSAGNISTVLGATGGVAPTKFQAGVSGVMSGLGQGQQFVGNISNIQAQQAGIRRADAGTDQIKAQTEIIQGTKDAAITAKNNELLQQGIQAGISTAKLTADNQVLTAIKSGDAAQMTAVMQNPETQLSAIEMRPMIESTFGQMRAAGKVSPEQEQAFATFRTASNIYPLQDKYQQSAAAMAGSTPFIALQHMSGLPADELLKNVTMKQDDTGLGIRTKLVAPNGTTFTLDDAAKDKHDQTFADFFSARGALQTGGRFSLPIGEPANQQQALAQAQSQALKENNLPTGDSAPQSQNGKVPDNGASTVAAANPAQPSNDRNAATLAPSTNPNNLGPTGQQVGKQTQPALAWQNSTPTYGGANLSSEIARESVLKNQMSQGAGKPTDFIRNATKVVLAQAKFDDEITKTLTTDASGAREKLLLADEIENAAKLAEKVGYPLGPGIGTSAEQWVASMKLSGDEEKGNDYRYMLNKFTDIKAIFAGNRLSQSGIAASELRSGMIESKILGNTPGLDSSPEYLGDVVTGLRANAKTTNNINDLTRYLVAQQTPIGQVRTLVSEYLSDPTNQSLIYDKNTGRPVPNPAVVDPIDWIKKKQGVNPDQEVKDIFGAATQIPPEAKNPAQQPAAGSGTANPFAPAQKTQTSQFPTPPPQAGARGGAYDNSPVTLKDTKAITDAATSGESLGQFQQAGSVPLKLDKPTPDLIARVITAESSGNPNASAGRDHTGLMQVGAAAFQDAQKTALTPISDRTDPHQNVVGGTAYLGQLLDRYHGNVDLALAANKDGMGTVDKILSQQNLNSSRATLSQIAPFLPNTDGHNTAAYVQKITGRGGVQPAQSPQQAPQSGGGFHDFLAQANPLQASTAQAEEPNGEAAPVGEMTPDQKKAAGWQTDPNAGPNGETQIFIGGSSNENTSPTGSGTPPSTPTPATQETSNNQAAKIPEVQPSARNDVPPVSQLAPAMAAAKAQAHGEATPWFPERTLAKFKQTAVGKFLFDPTNEDIFGAGENMLNAATFGLYDEGMGLFASALMMDGGKVRDGIREELGQFKKDYPKTAIASDIFGSVAGGAGAGMLFKSLGPALRIAKVTAPEFGGMGIGQAMKIGASQGAARSFGEAEGGLRSRLIGAGIGGTLGAATGLVAGGIGKSPGGLPGTLLGASAGAGIGGATAELTGHPVVPGMAIGAGIGAGVGAGGRPGVVGGGVGMIAGGMAGGPAGAAMGTALGAGLGTGTAMLAMKNPAVQKALAGLATRANNSIGLRAFASMATQLLTSKTPAEIQAGLTPVQAFIAKQIKHLTDGQIQGMIEELKSGHPDIPQRLVDVLKSSKLNTFTKLIRDVADEPETAQKVATFLHERVSNIEAGVKTELDATFAPEQAARMFLGMVDSAKGQATEDARLATENIYAFAKEQTPTFDSPRLRELMTAKTAKRAIAAARADFQNPRTQSELGKELAQTHLGNERGTIKEIYDRMMAGLPVDEQLTRLANLSKTLPDNSYEIMTRAQRIIKSMADDAAEAGNKTSAKDIGDLGRAIEQEMGVISPPWKDANVLYGDVLAKTDLLRKNDIIVAMTKLKEGNVEAALPKFMSLPVDDLHELMQIIPDKDMFKELAKNYLTRKLGASVAKGNIPGKLVSDNEWKRLAPMLGDEAEGFKAYLKAQADIVNTGRSLGAGSHTTPMAQGLPELRGAAGEESMHDIAHMTGGSVHSFMARIGQSLIRKLGSKMKTEFIKDLGETLVLNADKGIEGAQKILSARGATDKEIEELGPMLQQIQAALRAGTLNAPNAFLNESQVMKPLKEGKKKK